VRHAHSNAHSYSDGHGDTYTDSNADSYSDGHRNGDTHTDSNADSHSDSYGDGDNAAAAAHPDDDAQTYADAQAAADASSAGAAALTEPVKAGTRERNLASSPPVFYRRQRRKQRVEINF
jgi:hypothetical protein